MGRTLHMQHWASWMWEPASTKACCCPICLPFPPEPPSHLGRAVSCNGVPCPRRALVTTPGGTIFRGIRVRCCIWTWNALPAGIRACNTQALMAVMAALRQRTLVFLMRLIRKVRTISSFVLIEPAPMPMNTRHPRRFRLPHLALCAALLAPSLAIADNDAGATLAADDVQDNYRDVDLKQLVPASRMADGQRSIFAPTPVRFRATLAALPEPQSTDYLNMALGMLQISDPPRVHQSIILDYGGDRPLRAYVEDAVAARMAKELQAGQTHTFYAFHVYNTRVGPAFVVMSYGD